MISRLIQEMRSIRGLAVTVVVLVTALFVVFQLNNSIALLDGLEAKNAAYLAPAVLLMAAAVLCQAWIWSALLGWLQSKKLQNWNLIRFFLLTWPARYIPGTIPYHATRVLMAERLGSSKSAITASIAYEAILQVGAAAMLGVVAVGIATGLSTSASVVPYLLLLAPLATLPLALHPKVIVPVMNLLTRLTRREQLPNTNPLSTRQAFLAFAGFFFLHFLNGTGFYLVLRVVGADVNPLLAVGTYNLAGAAGVATVFVPSGLGVREAVIVAALGSIVSPETGLLTAGLARAVSIFADLAPMALLSLLSLALRLVKVARPEREVAPASLGSETSPTS